MPEIELLLRDAMVSARDGIVVTDATTPKNAIVFSNPSFQAMVGFSESELLGMGTRYLLGKRTPPTSAQTFRQALSQGYGVQVVLSIVCKNGEEKWFEISGGPVVREYSAESGGERRFFIGTCRDVSLRVQAIEQLLGAETQVDKSGEETTQTLDPVTALYSRGYFEEYAAREWLLLQRQKRPLSLYMVRVSAESADESPAVPEIVAGCLRQVFRRGIDLSARYDESTYVVVSSGLDWEEAEVMGERLYGRIEQALSREGANSTSIALGIASSVPEAAHDLEDLMDVARDAMQQALDQKKKLVMGELV